MQSFNQWQQNPVQGAIPAPSNGAADGEVELALVREKLLLAQQYLAEAKNLIRSTDLAQTHSDIYWEIAGIHFRCEQAISKIDRYPEIEE